MKTVYKVIAFFFFPKCKTAITDVGISYSKRNWEKYRNPILKK